MGDWWSTGNAIAVLTTMLGIGASIATVWYERRPRRRLVGYRVQMAIRAGGGSRGGRDQAVFGSLTNLPGISDATLVLLRIENHGRQSIAESDYTNNGPYGLTVDVSDLSVQSVAVIPDPDELHLLGHFADPGSIRYTDNIIYLPRVPLNPDQHYKLLILLSGSGDGNDLRVRGGIRAGTIVKTESVSVDDRPQRFSRPARLITVMLTACVVALAAIILLPDTDRGPMGCLRGNLHVEGSTSIGSLLQGAAKQYESDCPGAHVTVTPEGSRGALFSLASSRDRDTIAFSDGRSPVGSDPAIRAQAVAVTLFGIVVNTSTGVSNLTSDQIRGIFSGRYTDWSQIDPSYHGPVQVMSRTSQSGSRGGLDSIFGITEPGDNAPSCPSGLPVDPRAATYCQLPGAPDVVRTVASLPGAVGFADLRGIHGSKNAAQLRVVTIDGHQPDFHDRGYPFTEIEYAYSYGWPKPGGLAAAFTTYLQFGRGADYFKSDYNQTCSTPGNSPDQPPTRTFSPLCRG
ncbi:phosphate transport system substrate-binding protein [Frankia sp. AiPs1]|uniref:PstS family phosphate ABC transporter substrate-binding protein n=1 Tax=Frankia sp. AiPa1 TaxID=573492 RepID=UPI00202B829D|nr:substrate-binding domain-containing protein [Frankia sp. AiPa1]MCL9761692.1 substrate-binding domain-containing protein [Frankia sp. AiPa1]